MLIDPALRLGSRAAVPYTPSVPITASCVLCYYIDKDAQRGANRQARRQEQIAASFSDGKFGKVLVFGTHYKLTVKAPPRGALAQCM